MARKNGKDAMAQLVELMEQQLAETRLHREQSEALATGLGDVRVEMAAGFRNVGEEIRGLGDRLTNIVDKTAPLVSRRPSLGRIVLFGWAEGVWHPAAIVRLEDETLDLEVLGVSFGDERRIVRGVTPGDGVGHWRWPDLH